MQTLAQQLRDEGRKIGIEEGRKEGIKEGMKEGLKEGTIKTAKELIKRGVHIDIISAATGFSRNELLEMAEVVH